MARTIPNDSTFDVVTFTVSANGEVIDPALQIRSVTVDKVVNRIPTARILLRDGDAAAEDWEVSNLDTFAPGTKIEISAGRDSQNTLIFKGIVVKQRIQSSQYAESTLLVECKDESLKLTVGRKDRYFESSTDSELMEQIIQENGLEAEVQATEVSHPEMIQYRAIDWDFLLMRSAANGQLILVDDGVVKIQTPDTQQAPLLPLQYGATIYDFEAELDAQYQWKAVKGSTWDYANQNILEAESERINFQESGNLLGETLAEILELSALENRHTGQIVAEELQAWTDACLLRSRLAKIVGSCRFDGFADAKPGVMIELRGLGDRFNGNVYVTGVQQELVDGNWFTSVQFGLSREWWTTQLPVSEPPAAHLLPAINGLQIGKVVQLAADPDGEDRILVKLPIIDNAAQGIWARVATLDAGNNRGSFFRPEIDDEVIVGFLNNDPRDAIVLGMLHSSQLPAPLTATDENHEKGFFTRSEMKLLFNDEQKSITIETPAGNSLIISEDTQSITLTDQNQNELKMETSGITLKSPKDITIEATGKIELTATQDVNLQGMNVNVKANTQLTANGAAGAEFSAGGQTVVKGAMVMIN